MSDNQLNDPVIIVEMYMLAIDNEEKIDNGHSGFDGDDEADFEDEKDDLGFEEMKYVTSSVSTIEIRVPPVPPTFPPDADTNRASPDIHQLPFPVPSSHKDYRASAETENIENNDDEQERVYNEKPMPQSTILTV